MKDLPRYDISKSYEWNYDNAPPPQDVEVATVPGNWSLCGLEVDSPLGIPAGPLLNGAWCLYYASLGFDVITYKTVRSGERLCYPLPNLQPVSCGELKGGEPTVPSSAEMLGSWAVSFGMPSKAPEKWQADVQQTRDALPNGKLLIVSTVGTMQEHWSIDDLAHDYGECCRMAVESGADVVEINFSCPNVATCDGQLYQNPQDSGRVAEIVRGKIGDAPLVVKVGHILDTEVIPQLVSELDRSVQAIAMTNSIATHVTDSSGETMFSGQLRGICGEATREASLEQVRHFAKPIAEQNSAIEIIGVGGIGSLSHVQQFLDAGAKSTHLATAAMVDPSVALEIRRSW